RHREKIDWSRVAQLVAGPVGVPVPVSGISQSIDDGTDGGGDGLRQVVAQARIVQNTLPAGSTWDGKTDLPMTDAEFNKLMSGIDQDGSDSATPGEARAAGAPDAGAAATAAPTGN
ncbi:MAG TPA: hypothetical protein VFU61_07370, partial [Steroidobacteraceae bacterium]|nr:hypothetical protein [Steroidobacteraceae bacterium]